MMDKDYNLKELLIKQAELLFEKSKTNCTVEELCKLTQSIVEVNNAIIYYLNS